MEPGEHQQIRLRDVTSADLPLIAPFFRTIVAAGETYAYPEGLNDQDAASL